MIKIKLLDLNTHIPTKASDQAVGLDLTIIDEVYIKPKEILKVGLGFALEIPQDKFAIIVGRSSTLQKYGIEIMYGVIDPDYRGEIKLSMRNITDSYVNIKKGTRLAQLIFQYKIMDYLTRLVLVDELSSTERGEGGFGSSGT